MVAELKPTFITNQNAHLFTGHPLHKPGAYRLTRPEQGQWNIAAGDSIGPFPVQRLQDVYPLIPRSLWPDLIAKKDKDGSWLYDLLVPLGYLSINQQGGSCWNNGPARAQIAAWFLAAGFKIPLSVKSLAASFGWDVQGGGDPSEALAALVKDGIARLDLCQPDDYGSHSKWSAGWQADRENHRILPAHLLDGLLGGGQSFDAACTMALENIASSAGFTWWNHEIMGCVKVLDVQQLSLAMQDAIADAGGFQGVPRDICCRRPDYLGAGRFQAVYWNNWGHDTEFPTMVEGKGTPDIDNTGVCGTTLAVAENMRQWTNEPKATV